MNKIIISFIACALLLGGRVAGQQRFRFGVKAGVNHSSFRIKVREAPLLSTKNNDLYYAGLQGQLAIGQGWSFQPELFYAASGVFTYFSRAEWEEELRHLNIPLLIKYHPGKIGVYAGLQPGILLSAREMRGRNPAANDPDQRMYRYVDVTDSAYKKLNLSGVVGVEWTFAYRFGVDIRYQAGLNNIRAAGGATALTRDDRQSITLGNLQGGIYFRFGKKPKREKRRDGRGVSETQPMQ